MALKLGMWNRLAIVATLIISTAYPIYVVHQREVESRDVYSREWKLCINGGDIAAGNKECAERATDVVRRVYGYAPDLNFFIRVIGFTLAMCAVGYLLIRTLVGIGVCIARGRAVS